MARALRTPLPPHSRDRPPSPIAPTRSAPSPARPPTRHRPRPGTTSRRRRIPRRADDRSPHTRRPPTGFAWFQSRARVRLAAPPRAGGRALVSAVSQPSLRVLIFSSPGFVQKLHEQLEITTHLLVDRSDLEP